MRKILLLSAVAAALLTGCQPKQEPAKTNNYFDVSGMDTTINPADDFFAYANGKFVKNAHIPDDQSRWGSFDSLRQENIKKLRSILEENASAKDLKKGSLEQKVGDFYASGMDTMAIEKKGYEPLKPMLARIEAVKDYHELLDLLSDANKEGDGDLIGWEVSADQGNSATNIVNMFQTGTTLPEKGYYTRMDAATMKQREELANHIAKYFELTGTDSVAAKKQAAEVVALETAIAGSHRTPADLRDPIHNYNKMSVTALQALAPNIKWGTTLPRMGIKTDSVNVGQPDYYKALSELLASRPIDVWKEKVKFDYINSKAGLLSKDFRDEQFRFGQLFSGDKKQKERWKTIVSASDERLRDVLGELYVKKYFPPEAKKRMEDLVDNLQKAFKARINKLDWMSDSTKQRAQDKLAVILKKIGYPTKWKSFGDATITRDDYFGNNRALDHHDYDELIAKINKPVDKTEWGMTPSTVNAYYNPTYNEIVFPAGILQFPFFDPNADDAINYGGIGAVIGHEITHGFDDQGRLYDPKGNLKEWWQAADGERFNAKTKSLATQYSSYVVLDSLHVNGNLTLGENIADLGGVTIAYDAFQMTKESKDTTKIAGFTPNQRFFLGFAQVWRGVVRPELMRVMINTNPHSPYEFRVNGTLSNIPAFYEAWHVTPQNKMYHSPEQMVKIW